MLLTTTINLLFSRPIILYFYRIVSWVLRGLIMFNPEPRMHYIYLYVANLREELAFSYCSLNSFCEN